jgi:sugar phosphate permease
MTNIDLNAIEPADTVAISNEILEHRVFARAALRILPLFMFAFLFAFIDRMNIGFAKLQMLDALGFSNTAFGLGAGMFSIGYIVFGVPSNMIQARVGARLWIGLIMVTWGILSAATSLVMTPTQFYIVRFLLGAAEAGLIPGILYYTSTWFPGNWRGRIWSIFYISLASSGLIGGPLSGSILGHMSGFAGIAGWKWLFLVEGFPAILGGLLIFFCLTDRVEDAKWLTNAEKHLAISVLQSEKTHQVHTGLLGVITNPWVLVLCGIYFADLLVLNGLGIWIPTLIHNMGVKNVVSIGWLSALPSVCATITLLVLYRTADHFRERRWHLVILFSTGTIGLVASVLFQHHVALGVASLCLISIGTIPVPAMFWSVPTAMLGGTAVVVGIPFINSVANLSGFFGPVIIGYVEQHTGSPSGAVIILAAALAVGIILILSLPHRYVTNLGHQ